MPDLNFSTSPFYFTVKLIRCVPNINYKIKVIGIKCCTNLLFKAFISSSAHFFCSKFFLYLLALPVICVVVQPGSAEPYSCLKSQGLLRWGGASG
ncbi:MAG: hypothetical protein ACLS8T_43285, partial [Anaerobutyricum sp.]